MGRQMNFTNARHTTELLLAAIYFERAPDRSFHSFTYSKPNRPNLIGNLGIELNYNDHALTTAVLYLRRHGAPHLRALSVSDVRSQLTKFVSENFWTISSEAWDSRSTESFVTFLSDSAKQAMADAMAKSTLFVEPRELTLFPLSVVKVSASFVSMDFFLVPPSALTPELIGSPASKQQIDPNQFPPFDGSRWKRQPTTSWLGIWAPNIETAKRQRAVILGAIALLPHPMERYLFTGRTVTHGWCRLHGNQYTVSLDGPHTPAMSEDVVVSEDDHDWLALLASSLASPQKASKKRMLALAYQYRSWVPDSTRRFPTLFAALDAIYGDASQATQAVVDAVRPVMGPDYDFKRLRLLLSLRASVIHGGAPNVYESSNYHRYYEDYRTDAVRDLELIVARCLQVEIFGNALCERPHTFADLLFKKTGRRV